MKHITPNKISKVLNLAVYSRFYCILIELLDDTYMNPVNESEKNRIYKIQHKVQGQNESVRDHVFYELSTFNLLSKKNVKIL